MFQPDMDFDLLELDDGGESLAPIEPKQEAKSGSTCTQHNTFSATKDKANNADETVPESSGSDITVADLVGMDCEAFDSLDDILNLKDFSKEFKELEVESGMLGCDMWEETFTEVLFPSLLAV